MTALQHQQCERLRIAGEKRLKECIPPAYTEWIGREFLNTANNALCVKTDSKPAAAGDKGE